MEEVLDTIKTLVIKPIIKAKFSGLSSYTRAVETLGAELSKTGLYKTGLTKEEEKDYEDKMRLPAGTLNPRNNEYWGAIAIRLNKDKPTHITIASYKDELIEKVLKSSSKIATNSLMAKSNPDARFYIDDMEAVAEEEAKSIDFEMDAFEKLINMSIEEKRGVLRLYGRKGTNTLSESMVKSELAKKIKTDAKDFLDKINDKGLKIRMMIEELLEIGLFKKKGPYTYNGDDLIGSSTDEVIAYLSDLKNQSVKLNLETQIKKYRTGK